MNVNPVKVIIMRGIPGSGKTTWARKYLADVSETSNVLVVSADDFFTTGSGIYRYDPKRIGEAHADCLCRFIDNLIQGTYDIVVDNTNTTAVEIAPYYAAALAYGAEVKIVRLECLFRTGIVRNVHGVPPSTIWRMWQNIQSERLPPHWIEEILFGD